MSISHIEDKNGWYRYCPTCNKKIVHVGKNSKYNSKHYDKLKKECRSCCRIGKKCYIFGKTLSQKTKFKIGQANTGKTRTPEQKEKYSKSQRGIKSFWYGKKFSEETKIKISTALRGRKLSKQTKEKLSNQKKGINNYFFNKRFTKLHKENLRIAALKRLGNQNTIISYNPKACEFIDKLNKEKGWNLQHAMNGGEIKLCGYSLDGYDKEKNIVFEYDEKHHRYGQINNNDLIRQGNIINRIKPILFIRYDEWNNRLYDTITNTDLVI